MSSFGLQLSLNTLSKWQEFPNPMEMITKKRSGRRLFPILEYSIRGLDATKMYEFFIHMERVNNFRYNYTEGQWVSISKANPMPCPPTVVQHHSGAQTGAKWMSQPISFEQIRLTNCQDLQEPNVIYVQSMHKWRPVVTVCEMQGHVVGEFRLECTEFMAVTAYHNPAIIQTKVNLNKFASGFRKLHQNSYDSSSTSPPAIKRSRLSHPSPPRTPMTAGPGASGSYGPYQNSVPPSTDGSPVSQYQHPMVPPMSTVPVQYPQCYQHPIGYGVALYPANSYNDFVAYQNWMMFHGAQMHYMGQYGYMGAQMTDAMAQRANMGSNGIPTMMDFKRTKPT